MSSQSRDVSKNQKKQFTLTFEPAKFESNIFGGLLMTYFFSETILILGATGRDLELFPDSWWDPRIRS